nr:tyrosine-type recombinase/integrase [candidate division KSB1 bacterium]NIR71514.1 tyrosine-type recombinase/integrase [candidate division KSB1 bacterium]NIS27950.1 tyrosine-type recombinase/integrase [candidate division KSB1 bacterium]NIT74827.1 tyrosine-type recombinase/integrase [candidate division KSB1 bacterium]NIU28607.1 tyrosine-type recombinase/integrase [candidate division KSB1 bacterium]
MACLRKVKNTWQLQFYLDGKRRYKQFSPKTPKSVVLAEKKRIEAELALHKAGVKKFAEKTERVDSITLRELTEKVHEARQNEVSDDTLKRNLYAMKVFMEVVGADMLVSNLKSDHIDQFKKARYEIASNEYERKGWKFEGDKIKRGINKDLENVRSVFRVAAQKGMISESMVPKIERYKIDKVRVPKYLNDEEIIAIANQLEGEARLAFWIIRYTGARRGEIARKSLDEDRGLKWKHVDWMGNKVRLYGKKKERLVTLHPKLRTILLDRKAELGNSFDPEDHIIHFVRDTLTEYFSRAMKKAGINKTGAVHILRHTAITKVLGSSRNIRVAQ